MSKDKKNEAHLNMSAPCHCQVSDSGGETCCGSPTPPWREPALTCSSPSPATSLPATCGRSSRRGGASLPKVPVAPERRLGTSPVSTLKVMSVLVWLQVGLKGSGCKYSRLFNTCNSQITKWLKWNQPWVMNLVYYHLKYVKQKILFYQSNNCISIGHLDNWPGKKNKQFKMGDCCFFFFSSNSLFSSCQSFCRGCDCLQVQCGLLLLSLRKPRLWFPPRSPPGTPISLVVLGLAEKWFRWELSTRLYQLRVKYFTVEQHCKGSVVEVQV